MQSADARSASEAIHVAHTIPGASVRGSRRRLGALAKGCVLPIAALRMRAVNRARSGLSSRNSDRSGRSKWGFAGSQPRLLLRFGVVYHALHVRAPTSTDAGRLINVALVWLSSCAGPTLPSGPEEEPAPAPVESMPAAPTERAVVEVERGLRSDEPLPEPPELALVRNEDFDTPCVDIPSLVYAIGFIDEGRSLVVLHESGDQCVWSVRSGQPVRPRRIRPRRPNEREGLGIQPEGVRFAADGRWGATFSEAGQPLLWRLGRAAPPQRVHSIDDVTEAVLAGDIGVFQDNEGKVVVWSMLRRDALDVADGFVRPARMALRADGGALALADRQLVAAWSLPGGDELLARTHHSAGDLLDLSFVGEQLIAVAASADHLVWDLPAPGPAAPVAVPLGARGFDRAWIVPGSGDVLGVADGEATLHRVGPARRIKSDLLAGIRLDPHNKHSGLEVYLSAAGDRALLDDRLGVWSVDVVEATVTAAVRARGCRGRWALGPGRLIAVSGQILCLGDR